MLLKTRKAFVLPSVVGVCALMLAISGGLLMKTTESRLAMRRASQANSFGMSMDTVMRDFGRRTAEMAIAGEGPISMINPSNFAGVLRASFPEEWLQASMASPPMANIDVKISGFPDQLPDLMGSPTSYSILQADADRSNLIRDGQNFAGRRWGLEVSSRVEIFDNLAELEGSWYKNLESATGNFSGRTLGNIDPANPDRPVLMRGESKNIVMITEIPSQFSVQGQNIDIRPSSWLQTNKIGRAGSEHPVLLGKNVELDPTLDIKEDRRLVAKGRIMNRTTLPNQQDRAVAGAVLDQELEEAGSILLVNVGTRGPEIFRPPQDYSASLVSTGQQDRKAFAMDSQEHLRYWLPYYQCNIRVVVRMPSSSPLTNLTLAEKYSVSGVYSKYNNPPDERHLTSSLPGPFGGLEIPAETINRFGKAVLGSSAATMIRPVVVVSRHSYSAATGSQWINTIDVDAQKIQELARQAGLAAAAVHIDIRDQNGNFIPDAEKFSVIVRQGKVISIPFSIVTPGTIYLQGPFAKETTPPGTPHPFSLFAPKVRYGMISRDPTKVAVLGQKITVGGANQDTPSTPLEILGGSGSSEVPSDNKLANAHQGSGGLKVAPVHLKDWLIETFNIWVDL